MEKVLFTADEMNWLMHNHANWIIASEKTEKGTFIVDLKGFVTPTQLFDAGRAYQMYLLTPLDNQ
jgi:hypothetical protein